MSRPQAGPQARLQVRPQVRPHAPGPSGARTRAVAAAVLLALSAGVSGCGFGGVQDIPLPGGADLGAHPYTVKARFADVLDLVPQASVRVNDVAVGRVTGIALASDGWQAVVTMKVNGSVRLPANAYAHLEQSSLLGEKYVELSAPPAGQAASGRLGGGDVIPLARTNRNPEVEEVLGALSMVLNGGGVQQIRTISTELNKALSGNEPQVRDLLTKMDTLVATLDDHRQDITDALDGVNALSATLAARDREIGSVLTGLSPGLKVLERQRGSLVTMLRSLDTLSAVAVDTVDRSKDDMVADLRALAPTLQRLADAGDDLPDSLQVLLTYPFTDEVLRGVKGDYLNAYLDLTAAPGTVLVPALQPGDSTYPDVGPQPPETTEPDPGSDDGGTGDPGTEDPGSGDPGTEDPGSGSGDPGTDDPGSGDPGTDDPGDPGTGDPASSAWLPLPLPAASGTVTAVPSTPSTATGSR